MRFNKTHQTPHTHNQSGRDRVVLHWWDSPAGFLSVRRRRIWLAVATAAFTLMATISATSLWNYYGLSLPVRGPTSDVSESKFANAPAPTPGSMPSTQWVFDAGQPLSAPATAVDGVIYLVSGTTAQTGAVSSLSSEDGSQLWSISLNSLADYSPVVAGDLVFVGTRAGDLLALDRYTGALVWTTDLESSVVGSAIVEGGVIYIASKSVYAIDAATGQQLWRHDVGGDVSRQIRLSNGIIAAISSDGNVNLINASNGRRRLTFPLWFSTSAGPTISGTTLIIPGDRAFVQALDITERDIPMEKAVRYWWTKLWLWDMAPRPPLPRGYLWQNRILDGDTAYALGSDDSSVFLGISEVDGTGTVVALDLDTGEATWEVAAESRILAPAVLAEDSLVIGTEHSGVLAVDRETGAVLWQLGEESGLAAAPTVTNDGLLLVPTAEGFLKAVR